MLNNSSISTRTPRTFEAVIFKNNEAIYIAGVGMIVPAEKMEEMELELMAWQSKHETDVRELNERCTERAESCVQQASRIDETWRAENSVLRSQNTELLETLYDLFNQHCQSKRLPDGRFTFQDSGLSANELAADVLLKHKVIQPDQIEP